MFSVIQWYEDLIFTEHNRKKYAWIAILLLVLLTLTAAHVAEKTVVLSRVVSSQ